MRELTPEEEKYLVKYCMESKENTRLALAIGHIQVQLRAKILSSFLKKLDKNVRKKLEACGRLRQWKTKVIETKVRNESDSTREENRFESTRAEKIIYVMTMKIKRSKYISAIGKIYSWERLQQTRLVQRRRISLTISRIRV